MTDGEDPDVEDENQLTTEEAVRRMPALHQIDSVEIREEVTRLTATAPEYFWRVPASTSGYHHPACQFENGLWIHTLMVCTVLERLIPSYVEQGRITRQEADYARAAAILHDQRKNGPPKAPADTSVSNHDVLMARVIEDDSELPAPIASAVAAHMGPWYDGPVPTTALQKLVHNADMVASTQNVTPKLPAPVPDELQDAGVGEAQL